MARSPYGYAMNYTPKPKPKPKPKPVAPTYYGPPPPPDRRTIDALFPEYPTRSEPDWNKLLDDRVKPFIDSVEKSTLMNRGQEEFKFEQARDANQGLGLAFAKLLTGGKGGDEGAQFAKENFGGEYLPLQAMSIAADHLTQLTNDWNEKDWEISSQYQEQMAKVPGLREQLRQDIESGEGEEYDRKFKYANLLLDEAWNVYNANAAQYKSDQQMKLASDAIRKQQNQQGYTSRKDAVGEAAKFADDTGTIWKVVKNKDGSFTAVDTYKKKPVKPGSKPKPPSLTGPANQEFITVNGQVRKNPNYKPPKPAKKAAGTSNADKEAALALKVQTDYRDLILGKLQSGESNLPAGVQGSGGQPTRVGGMDYDAAVTWLRNLAASQFRWRSGDWINDWVYRQLLPYFPGTARPRQGD